MSTESTNSPEPLSHTQSTAAFVADGQSSVPSSADGARASGNSGSSVPKPHVDSQSRSGSGAAGQASGAEPSRQSVSQELILETRQQIRNLVEEITQLSQSNCDKREFFEGFLTRCVQALASDGGAIWEIDSTGVNLEYQINLSQTSLADPEIRDAHNALVSRLIDAGEPRLIAPHSGSGDDSALNNPTGHLLVVAPLIVNQQTVGLVEIFQRPDSGPATQRGYLRFVDQMCSLANNYLHRFRLREFADRQQMWQSLDTFVRNIHRQLDVRQTVFAIANEGRRVVGCDRASVAVRQGNRFQVRSVSGLDSIERRANQVKLLEKLVRAVACCRQPLWYSGDDSDIPPQIEKYLHEYLDVGHARAVGLLPVCQVEPAQVNSMNQTEQPDTSQEPGPVIGMLVVEQLGDEMVPASMAHRATAVAEHASYALSNAISHNSVPFAGLLRSLGRLPAVTSARNLPKTVTALVVLTVLFAAMFLIQRPFTLGAGGKLVPETVHEVFARHDGILTELNLPGDPATLVKRGDVVARLENNELLVQIKDLQGRLDETKEQIVKFTRLQNTPGLSQFEILDADSELNRAIVQQNSLRMQLELKYRQLDSLDVRAPATGRIVNWKLRDNLLQRPVQRGQNLMTIVDPETEWTVELELPERRVMHLQRALAEKPDSNKVGVTFTLASHPGRQFRGELTKIDQRLDVHSDEGNSLLLTVSLDEESVPPELLREGTRVTAKIHAGTRSLGYVWLHELFETVRSSVMFWF